MGADGYRRQTVTVNGAVMGGTGAGAGVWLAGGGRVVIGPKGSVGAASGIAILATGDTPVENGEPLKPRLHVSMNLDGRRVAEVLGDDWIVNDGGETTIVVNNVKLHDGAAGVTGLTAPNGARDVLIIQAEGVTVDRSTGAWVVSQRAAGVIADRDFSADDFTESSEPETPEEPTEKPKTPGRIIEVYAPRAAVYEALPGLLLGLTGGGRDGARLSGGRRRYGSDQRSAYDFKRIAADYESLPGVFRLGGSAGERLRLGGSPVWVRLSGGKGSYKSGEASVGAAYDFRRLAAEAGVDVAFPWNKDITGTVSVRHVQASAEVSSPTGGGDVDAKGFGAGLGVSWGGASGYYVDGRLSVTGYKLDLSSDKRGRLKGDVGALAHSLSLEAGRRIALGTRMSLTPRARLVRSGVSMDRFTDAVNSRVKLTDPKQLKGVVGLAAETGRVRARPVASGTAGRSPSGVRWTWSGRSGAGRRPSRYRERSSGRSPREPGFCWVWAGSGAGAASRSASRRRRTARVRMSGNTPARSISESGSRAQSNEWNPTASPVAWIPATACPLDSCCSLPSKALIGGRNNERGPVQQPVIPAQAGIQKKGPAVKRIIPFP